MTLTRERHRRLQNVAVDYAVRHRFAQAGQVEWSWALRAHPESADAVFRFGCLPQPTWHPHL